MWPQLTNIEKEISATIKSRSNTKVASKLNPWVRIISGAEVSGVKGLVIASNNDFKLFKTADENFGAIYGSKSESGAIGYDLANKAAIGASGEGRGFRPSPIIKALTSKEGKDQISRELNLTLQCFSKDQMELLQAFLMEPGYNLCVEWGFNTTNALSQMIDTTKSLDEILNSIASRCLNQDNIHNARKSSAGEYDIFLGFIVGGNVTSDGESFQLTIKCKGAPGLPTFLQTHKKTQELDASGKIIELPTVHPFPISELEEEVAPAGAGTAVVAGAMGGTVNGPLARRRFKAMFNALPAEKQIKEIKELSSTEYSEYDFINFDEVVNQKLLDYESVGLFEANDISVGNATLAKESLFNNDRYFNMGLCAKLLNLNGGLNTLTVGGKTIKVKIDISNTIIGAFPHMFSTKPDKLIIPGSSLPPFKKYFLSTIEVQQQADGKISDEVPVDYSTGDKKFPETTDLNSSGHKESANYWGYLRNLFVNFDQVFYPKITQTNKTIREIFLDILNELSSGVNSFWNFQIVETTVTKDKPVEGMNEGDIVITVIDENWVGKNANTEPPTKFIHAGIESAFLSADLDISIPQDMTSMLVAKRLSLATNPDSAIVNTGELFNSNTDLFMKLVTTQGTGGTSGSAAQTEPEMTAVERLTKEYEDINTQKTSLQTKNAELASQIRDIRTEYINKGVVNVGIREFGGAIASIFTDAATDAARDREFARIRALEEERDAKIKAKQDEIDANDKIISDLQNKSYEKSLEVYEAQKKAAEDAKAAEQAALSKNFEKISLVANPSRANITMDTSVIKSATVFDTAGELRIYTLNDGNYFDRLRNDAFSPNGSGNDRLSHPLPIKYNFKTIGVSGLRRGDTFNILGIPDKYAAHGLFQITQIEHELNGMEWQTSVTGEYRQQNS